MSGNNTPLFAGKALDKLTGNSAPTKLFLFTKLFLLGYALLIAWAVYHYMILPSGPFRWDQAAHSVIAALVAQDIQVGNWLAFFYDLYRQVYWPPLHPLLLGITFSFTGLSIVTARSLSLVLFLAAALLIYLTGLKLSKDRGHFVALIATILFLTSPALLPYAAQVMLEMTAIFFLVLTLFLYIRLDESSGSWSHIALGIALVSTFLAKSNYGILLIITLFIDRMIEARRHPGQLLTRANMTISLPIILVLLFWFAYPPKIQRTWEALVNIPFGVSDPYSIEGLLFYPRAFWISSGHLFFLILFTASLILALIKFRHKNIRFLALLVVVQLVIAQMHQTKVARHILTIFPSLFLLCGFVLAVGGFDFKFRGRNIKLSALLTILTLLLAQLLLVNALKPISPPSEQVVINRVSEILSDNRSSLVISSINQINPTPPLLEWMLIEGQTNLNPVHSDIAMNYDQDDAIAGLTTHDVVPPLVREWINGIVGRRQQPGQVRTVYLDNSSSSYSQNPQAFSRYLKKLDRFSSVERVIIVMPADIQKSFIPGGTMPFTADFYGPALSNLGLKQISTEEFERANTRVEIYE